MIKKMSSREERRGHLYLFLEKNAAILSGIFIGFYVAFFSWISFLKFKNFVYNDFDLAVHDQVLWNILHGSIHSSILGIDFLGNHVHLISFLIAPLCKLFPSPLTLLFLQTLALGLAAWPLYLIARDALNRAWAAVIVFIYTFYPALGYANLFEFHPTVFSTLFLFWMIYHFTKKRFGYFILFMFLGMFCQENIPLAVIMMGLYALLKRRPWKWVLWPVIIGAAYFWFSVKVIIPYFNKATIHFISIYRHLGTSYGEIFKYIILHPVAVLKYMLTKKKLLYLSYLFLPVSYVPLLSPLAFALLAPFLMQHLLSFRETELSIAFHYAAEMIPFIFFAFVLGVRNLLKITRLKAESVYPMALVLLVCLSANVSFGPQLNVLRSFERYRRDDKDRVKETVLKMIPAGAGVVTTFEFLPRLTHRENLYSFHHVYMGRYTLSPQPYSLPPEADYALLDVDDIMTFYTFYHPQNYRNFWDLLSRDPWGVVDVRDTVVLFKKNAPSRFLLYKIYDRPLKSRQRFSWTAAGAVELADWRLGEPEGDLLPLTFYWRCLQATPDDIIVFFDLVDEGGRTVYRALQPICYRIYPTNAWQAGEWIEEFRRLLLPSGLKNGRYDLKIGFLNFATGMLYPVNEQDSLGRVSLGETVLEGRPGQGG